MVLALSQELIHLVHGYNNSNICDLLHLVKLPLKEKRRQQNGRPDDRQGDRATRLDANGKRVEDEVRWR
jgi:hypothetical protein